LPQGQNKKGKSKVNKVGRMGSLLERFNKKILKTPYCWEWQGAKNTNGRGCFHVKPGYRALAPRVSYELHRGPIPYGLWVLHTCDNAGCVNPDHLYLGTHTDNQRDVRVRGTKLMKLSLDDYKKIATDTRTGRAIALEYGISDTMVYKIKRKYNAC